VKYFFFGLGRPDPNGQKYVTMGKDFHAEGGASKEEHQQIREITEKFAEGVKQDGVHAAPMILKDVLKKVNGS